jgi:methionyl-tRNA synthetase
LNGWGSCANHIFPPFDNEYLSFRGTKLCKSRGAFVEVSYFLSKYDPDPLRFYLTATAPETRDTEFSWEDFVERNNHVLGVVEGNELVATWGNLANARGYSGSAELCLQALRRARAGAG